MNFKVEPKIFECLPTLYIGVVAARNVHNEAVYPQIERLLTQSVSAARRRFANIPVKTAPEIVPYRKAFRKLGLNPNRFPCSVEAMFSRISKGKDLPHINPLVDLNNSLSLKYVLPMGTHDISSSAEDIEMRYAVEGDTFIPFGSTQSEAVDAGEVVYAVGHEVRTRRWTWRQSEQGKIAQNTKCIFFPIDGFTDVNKTEVDCAQQELAQILREMFCCPVVTGFIDKDHLICPLE